MNSRLNPLCPMWPNFTIFACFLSKSLRSLPTFQVGKKILALFGAVVIYYKVLKIFEFGNVKKRIIEVKKWQIRTIFAISYY